MTEPTGVNKAKRRMLVGASTVIGAVGTGMYAWPFLGSWMPSEKAKAFGAPIEVDITKLPSGAMKRDRWRGKAIYAIRLTSEMRSTLKELENRGTLLDPTSLKDVLPDSLLKKGEGVRQLRDDMMILIGVCTHLGCAPLLQGKEKGRSHTSDWIGGFFCPCHGSKFDYTGRVFKGVPAPKNLVIPPYKYISENLIIIGEEDA